MYFTLFSCYNDKSDSIKINQKNDSINNHNSCCENSRNNFLLNVPDAHHSVKISNHDTNFTNVVTDEMIFIEGGEFMMGSVEERFALQREFPRHRVSVTSFFMDAHEVTNYEFKKFVQETGYITVAEKHIDWNDLKKQLPPNTPKLNDEQLEPGSMVFMAPKSVRNLIDYSQWWYWLKGANWKHPHGPESSIEGMDNYPVVHIAYSDALAYSSWCGKRLPTEAEWEWAARGGLENKIYPWGNELVDDGSPKCNYWSGVFPISNDARDGFKLIAPVKQFPPNGYGLYDMAGNVWEICADWFDTRYYETFDRLSTVKDPKGPKTWSYSLEPYDPKRVIRGGSYLCNDSYCSSYRVSARMPYSEETGMSHVGFRCVKDI